MVSRRTRVIIILALFGWTLSGVPDRVQEQRAAVADLAAERGAASAGGALLASMADLKALRTDAGTVWTMVPGVPCGAAAPTQGYEAAVEAVRRARACKALAQQPEGATTPRLSVVDGDAYLVLPGPVGWQEGTGVHFENLEVADLHDLRMIQARQVVVIPPEPPEPDPPLAAALAAVEAARVEATRAEANARLESNAADLARQTAELDRLHTMAPEEANRTGVAMGRTVIQTLQALGDLGVVNIDLGDHGSAPSIPPALLLAPATVAWWPPIQAEVEARTGIPLQVGGEPPHARAILPGHRLAGVPVWSLPTPATEGAFDL